MGDDGTLALTIDILALVLALCWLFGRLARLRWFLELFSHFTLQYMLAAVPITAAGFILGRWPAALLGLGVLAFTLAELYRLRRKHGRPSGELNDVPDFTIALHNRLFTLKNHESMQRWLRDNANRFDAALFIETTDSHWRAIQSVADLFPHQYRMTRKRPHGLVFISRHPMLEVRETPLPDLGTPNQALHVRLDHGTLGAVSIHCVHPTAPLTPAMARQRDSDLRRTAELAAADPAGRRLMMGDWNLTPFSPLFGDLVRTTGLLYQFSGWRPLASWPSFAGVDLLRIPLDHILHGGDMRLVSLETGPAMGSDHRPIIAQFIGEKSHS